MLGNKISSLYRFPKSLITVLFGQLDINARQKWKSLWPVLKTYNGKLDVLDAGCATGEWTLELAKRMPDWNIKGIDIKGESVHKATAFSKKLNLSNCRFEEADFLTYNPNETYDLVIGVSSSHYFNDEDTQYLFKQYNKWLKPGGEIVLFLPRNIEDVPVNPGLKFQEWHKIFSKQQIETYCKNAGLEIKQLEPKLGKKAVMAKQIDAMVKNSSIIKKILVYPTIVRLNRAKDKNLDNKSLMWLLVATKN